MKKHTIKQYAKALFEALEQSPSAKKPEIITSFVHVLKRNNQLKKADEVIAELNRMFDEKENALELSGITSGHVEMPTEINGKTVRVTVKKDISTKGTSLQIRDIFVDNTISGRINRLREAFK